MIAGAQAICKCWWSARGTGRNEAVMDASDANGQRSVLQRRKMRLREEEKRRGRWKWMTPTRCFRLLRKCKSGSDDVRKRCHLGQPPRSLFHSSTPPLLHSSTLPQLLSATFTCLSASTEVKFTSSAVVLLPFCRILSPLVVHSWVRVANFSAVPVDDAFRSGKAAITAH